MKLKIKLVILYIAFVLAFVIAGLAIYLSPSAVYAASGYARTTKSDFIVYDGTDIDFRADVEYNAVMNYFNQYDCDIYLRQTLCTDKSDRANLYVDEIFYITLFPTEYGAYSEYSRTAFITSAGERLQLTKSHECIDDISGTLFRGNDLYVYEREEDGDGNFVNGEIVEGEYTVLVKGTMTGGATKQINNTFTYVVDLTPPKGYLSGVENGGITNKDVAFTWTEDNCTATLDGADYRNGVAITAEGEHRIVLTDCHDNESVYSFIIDKTKPVGTVSGVNGNGYSNGTVKVNCAEAGVTAMLNGNSYQLGSAITAEGSYEAVLTDVAGNVSDTYVFIIDKTKPTARFEGLNENNYSNSYVAAYCDEGGVTATLDGVSYTLGYKIRDEGGHVLRLTDLAGNASDIYTFTIDTSGPSISGLTEFTNGEFTLTADDKFSAVKHWEYRLNDGRARKCDGATVTIGGGESSNGVWHIEVYDELGNSSTASVKHAYRPTFGNSGNIYNSFTVASYYTVTLQQKNFAVGYGVYTFSEYAYALDFAVSKEWDSRVITLAGGNSWNYLTAGNENVRQIYTDRDELVAVINSYAERNISARQILPKSGAQLKNPTDKNGVTRDGALTRQLSELPQVLSDYAGLPYMLAPASFALTAPQRIVDGNTTYARGQYVSDGISLRVGPVISLSYGTALGQIDCFDEQGWYLIEENDVAGNVEKYLIYIDCQQPVLQAEVSLGDGTKKMITYTPEYVEDNARAMRYVAFDVHCLTDNIDDYSMLSIEGRRLNERYVYGDAIPILDYEHGFFGPYTVTVYDRSLNAISFEIYVAGEKPTLAHSSLESETFCRFTVQVNDANNAITDIKLFKQLYDGSEVRLDADSFGTAVSSQNLEYRIDVGGKYVFEFTDLYGRTVRSDALFYRKGLPTAKFSGVKEGGVTKNDVNVTFAADVSSELYTYNAGEWLAAQYFSLKQNLTENVLSITAAENTSYVYKLVLYLTSDKNLFTEYTFEIDGVPPQVKIFTSDGEAVAPEAVTSKNFYVSWQESGYTAYYQRQGSLSSSRYNNGAVISSAGTYVFKFTDSAYNELAFTVTLDNAVTYTLEGSYTLYEGRYLTRNSFIFTVLEQCRMFRVNATNGIAIANGQKIAEDGTYEIYVCDMYGNELNLTLIVDKIPPTALIFTVSGERITEKSTKENFRVVCEESGVRILYAFNGSAFTGYDGQTLVEAGNYVFRLTDRGGNEATVSLTVDRKIEYTVEGDYVVTDEAYRSGAWVRVVPGEEMSLFTVTDGNGKNYDVSARINSEGKFYVRLVDVAGNEADVTVIIDKTVADVTVITESGAVVEKGGTTREAFKVITEEDGVTVKYRLANGQESNYDGGTFDTEGYYLFSVTDILGNTMQFAVTLNRSVAIKINGDYAVDGKGIYVSKSWLSFSAEEEMNGFYVKNSDGETLIASNRISEEGKYSLYAEDVYGNALTLFFEIDKTPPFVELNGVAVGGATKSDVEIALSDFVQAYYAFNGGNAVDLNERTVFSEEGRYTVVAKDFANNSVSISFVIDKTVDVKTEHALYGGQVLSEALSFTFGETVTATLNCDGVNSSYKGGEIRAAGKYTLTAVDGVGNKIAFEWVIIPAKANFYKIPVAADVSVTKDGAFVSATLKDGYLELYESGKYVIETEHWSVKIEVDDVEPAVTVESTKKSVIISAPNKDNLTYELYRNGKKVSFGLKDNAAEITAKGDYRLVVRDGVGNVSEYNFTLNYISTWTLVLIIVVSVLGVALVTALIVVSLVRKRF